MGIMAKTCVAVFLNVSMVKGIYIMSTGVSGSCTITLNSSSFITNQSQISNKLYLHLFAENKN